MDPVSIMHSFEIGLDNYVKSLQKQNTANPINLQQLLEWKQYIIDKCKTNLDSQNNTIKQLVRKNYATNNYIKQLKSCFAISKVDKLQHNLVFTCKDYYYYKMAQELSSNTYQRIDTSLNDIITSQQQFNNKYRYTTHPRIMYMYAM